VSCVVVVAGFSKGKAKALLCLFCGGRAVVQLYACKLIYRDGLASGSKQTARSSSLLASPTSTRGNSRWKQH
jgi:hypothetical protein